MNGVQVVKARTVVVLIPLGEGGCSSPWQNGLAFQILECLRTGEDVLIQHQMFLKILFFMALEKQW